MTRLLFAPLALLALALPAGAQDKKPVRIFAEAEDFTVTSGWKVLPYRENYYASTFAITFLSRMACLSAPGEIEPGKKAVAEQVVTVPYEDTFEVKVRYEQPYGFAAEFTIEVEQGGKVVATFPCGRLTDPKVWAFTDHKRVPMERYGWSGTDNIVWQEPGSVKLSAGPAKLRLVAAEQKDGDKPRVNIAKRNVDVVCLTNDRAGVEAQKKAKFLEYDGWLVQDGDVFLRVTNPKDAPGPVVPVVAPFDQGQHSPYYVHVRDWPTQQIVKSGRTVSETKYTNAGPRSEKVKPEQLAKVVEPIKGAIPESEYLAPGDTSGWVPLGQSLDALHNSQWFPKVVTKAKTADVYLRLEFGVPDDKGGIKVVKDVTVKGPAAGLSPACFEMPGCVNPNQDHLLALTQRYWKPEIRTQKEALDWLNAEIAKFPKVGSVPKRMPFYGIMGFSGAAGVFPEARQLALALGDNTTFGGVGKKRELVAHWPDPSMEAIKKHEARKGGFDDLGVVSYGDEMHLPAIPLKDDDFAKWLADKGIRVEGGAKYTNDKKAPLYYYSQIAAKEKGAARFAAGTAYYASKGVRTGVNYSPHANYLVTELDYIRPFKLKAMSMPWTEDYVWQIAEFSPQAVGYLVSGVRAGAKYDDLPIHMYVMPHSPGQLPNEFRMSYYASIAHGAKMINYFCATPSAVGGTENYVDTNDLKMWQAIYTCTREAGVFEDYVVDGKVRPAKVALLLSSTDEIVTGVNNFSLALHNNERKALYYALRHSQTPVDFLSEDDVIEGRARDYKLIYVTQQYLQSRCVESLQKWCESGGTVVSMAGGGYFNEFQKENPAAAKFYGATGSAITTDPKLVSKYLLKENTPFFSKHDLPQYEPMDTVHWHIGGLKKEDPDPAPSPNHVFNVPVIAWKQSLTATDGQVIGKFKDGSAAVVMKRHGTGRAILFGFLPGQAYVQSGLPVRPVDRGASADSFAHFLPTGMRLHLLPRLTDDFLGPNARDAKPVVSTDGLVEATCIDTPAKGDAPARLAVPLVNWAGQENSSLTVTIRGLDKVTKVRSVERGELKFAQVKGAIQINLPLNVADMLLIDK